MNNQIIKSKRISSKDLGISLFPTNVSSKYYEMAEARRKRWAEEDAEKATSDCVRCGGDAMLRYDLCSRCFDRENI